MHDSRPALAADAAEIGHVMQQCVHERPGIVSRTGMDDHSGSFVYYCEIVILKNYIERYVLGFELSNRNIDELDLDLVTFPHLVRRFCGCFIYKNVLCLDKSLQP